MERIVSYQKAMGTMSKANNLGNFATFHRSLKISQRLGRDAEPSGQLLPTLWASGYCSSIPFRGELSTRSPAFLGAGPDFFLRDDVFQIFQIDGDALVALTCVEPVSPDRSDKRFDFRRTSRNNGQNLARVFAQPRRIMSDHVRVRV